MRWRRFAPVPSVAELFRDDEHRGVFEDVQPDRLASGTSVRSVSFAVGADAYDRFMGRYSAPLAPAFAEFAAVIDGQHVLDVGCGPGALTAELVKRLGPTAVGAVDPSDTFVAAAHARYPAVDVRRATNEGGDAENVAENPMRWWDLADVWCIWDVGLRSSVSRR